MTLEHRGSISEIGANAPVLVRQTFYRLLVNSKRLMRTVSKTDLALILVVGLPGVGKTTVAEIVSDHMNAVHLRSDIIRKELFEQPEYSHFETSATYSELFKRAAMKLEEGVSVVVDATFDTQIRREYAQHITKSEGCEFRIIWVKCDPKTVKQRLEQREEDASDANYAIYEQKRERFDPVQLNHQTINNSGTINETSELLEKRFFLNDC